MAATSGTGFRRTLAVLRPGPFRRYMLGETLSMTGTWMQAMAQSWVMTTLSHSAFMLGMVSFASGVPQLLLTMTGGSFADRYDKKRIIVGCLIVQIGLAIAMGALVQSGTIQLWHVLAMAVVLGISNAFEMPAASALTPELVAKEEIAAAVAIDRSVFHATRMLGPVAAGVVIGWWGNAAAFYANAISFLPLIIALLSIAPRALGSAEEEAKRGGGMKEGFAFVRSDRPTLAMIALCVMATLCVFPVMAVLLPLYARDALGLDPRGMGLLMSFSAVGSLSGAIGLLGIRRERRGAALIAAAGGATLSIAGLAAARGMIGAAFALIGLALSFSTLVGLANTTIQERAPDYLRGRVSAVAGLSFFGLMPFAALGITGLSDAIGMRSALTAASVIFALGSSYLLLGPGRRLALPLSEAVAAETL